MTMLCNFYKRQSNLYNVIITSDVWDHEGATRTQGTITIDGKVLEWHLEGKTPVSIGGEVVEWIAKRGETDINGELSPFDDRLVNEIFGALAERHCPDASDGKIRAQYGDDGCCPVCAARHELDVYNAVGTLRTAGLKVEMARVTDGGEDR